MPSKPTPKQSKSTTLVDPALSEKLRAVVLALPAELVAAKTCEIAKRDGQTLGYVVFGSRKLRLDVPDGHGKIERIPVANSRDITEGDERTQEGRPASREV